MSDVEERIKARDEERAAVVAFLRREQVNCELRVARAQARGNDAAFDDAESAANALRAAADRIEGLAHLAAVST